MHQVFRWLLFGVLAAVALTACSSNGEDSGVITAMPVATAGVSTEDTAPAEAADLPTRRPQFLNSFADW